ncbi:MAG: LPS assembly protein LptD, partial [Planctomycetota bacterium]|nr:LPS assembly protein LptD [Planctomycetota bacterium]
VDARANTSDDQSELYREALRARGLLDVAPTAKAEVAELPVQVAPTAEKIRLNRPKPQKRVDFSVGPGGTVTHQQIGEQSVIIAKGEIMLSQGSPAQSGEYLELRADAAVLYAVTGKLGGGVTGLFGRDEPEKPSIETPPDEISPEEEPRLSGDRQSDRESVGEWISAVYLEGDVVLMRGQRMIRASRLYYDFRNDQALILDVVARALESTRGLPIYVRAEQVRQLSPTEYTATDAQITTSEFYTPHVALGAKTVYLKDRTPRNEKGEIVGVEAGTYKATHTTLNLEGTPISYWPVSSGDFSRDRMAFKSTKFGYSSDFGATMETRWYFFNLLGLDQPEGFDATFKMDYFTKRGPGTGIDLDYERENYYGLFRGYYIYDDGDDDIGDRFDRSGDRKNNAPDHKNRGRALWRHRQFLPKDWELTLEVSYISDDQYMENFERNEFENGKDQETLAYLLRRQENWQFSVLANMRINKFLTQTEHLPDFRFSLIGEPLTEWATFYHDSRAGVVRYRPDNRRLFNGKYRVDNTGETGSVMRADAREELEFPLKLGPVNVTPFVTVRGTTWDDSPERIGNRHSRGGQNRIFASYGVRGNIMFSKVDDSIESELLDLHRMRHVIKADMTAWNAHTNVPPKRITPFDSGVEDIDDFGGVVFGLRQRFQTKRGGPGHWRSVDWITWDVEAGFFNDKETSVSVSDEATGDRRVARLFDAGRRTNRSRGDFISARPEDSISSSFVRSDFQYRISDSTVVVHDAVFDLNRGNVGSTGLSLAVQRKPRLAYFVGWRYIHDTDNNLLAFGADYKLSEKHIIAFRESYDIAEGRNLSTDFTYIRRWPRWYTAVTINIDRAIDDLGINLSIWPEGAPRLALGSKRYTGLTESVGVRPN